MHMRFEDAEISACRNKRKLRLNPMALALPAFRDPLKRIDGNDHCAPLNAEFNIPYVMALTVLGVKPGPRWHQNETYQDPRVINLMQRVTTAPDPAAVEEATRALRQERIGRFRKGGGSITVRSRGREFVLQTEYSRGDPWTPETHPDWASIGQKFHNFCDELMTAEQIEWLVQYVRHLDEMPDVSSMLRDL